MRGWIWPVRGEDTPQADHPPLHSAGWSVGQSIRLRRSAFPTHARRLARSANALAVLDYGMSWAAVAKILSRHWQAHWQRPGASVASVRTIATGS